MLAGGLGVAEAARHAPQYSVREILRTLAWQIPLAFGVVLACKYWLTPRLAAFVSVAHCRTILGLPGEQVLWYGLFVGLPLLHYAILGPLILPNAWRTLRTRHYPPPGQKVLRRTRIRTGRTAVWIGALQLLVPNLLIALAIWGGLWGAPQTLEHIYARPPASLGCSDAADIRADPGKWLFHLPFRYSSVIPPYPHASSFAP